VAAHHTNHSNTRVDITVITATTITIDIDNHHIKVGTITASNRTIGPISTDLLHNSIVHHPHLHSISKVIVVTYQWIQVTLSHNRDVSHQYVPIVIVVIESQSLAIVSTVARQVTSFVTVQPTSHSRTSSVTM
jgi:hypothetical protein